MNFDDTLRLLFLFSQDQQNFPSYLPAYLPACLTNIMASSRSQASKSSDKRKRDKADQDESSHKKKRKQGLVAEEDLANTPSKSRHMDNVKTRSASKQQAIDPSVHDNTLGEAKSLQKWRISEPMGGRMSDIDSIFSADEKYILSHPLPGKAP